MDADICDRLLDSTDMRTSTEKKEPSNHPEFDVRAEVIGRFFSPPLASSTFYDFVNKGKIVPLKGIRGFYKLNDSLRRLGLREVSKLPDETPVRTPEEIILFAFHSINPEVFNAPAWLLGVETITEADVHHAQSIVALHFNAVTELSSNSEKHGYLQGVLDHAAMEAADRAAGR